MCYRGGQAELGCSVEFDADRFRIARVCFAECLAVLPVLVGSYPYLHANPETAQNHPAWGYYMVSQNEILTNITKCDIFVMD